MILVGGSSDGADGSFELADEVELDLVDLESGAFLQFLQQVGGDVFEDAFADVIGCVGDVAGLSASQVQVVVAGGVVACGPVAAAAGDLVGQARRTERFERVVDRRQAQPLDFGFDRPVQLVRGRVAAVVGQRMEDGSALSGATQAVLRESLLEVIRHGRERSAAYSRSKTIIGNHQARPEAAA